MTRAVVTILLDMFEIGALGAFLALIGCLASVCGA